MTGARRNISLFLSLAAILVALSVTSAGCSAKQLDYPEQQISKVWERSIAGTSARLYPKDTGAADVAPSEFTAGPLPMEYIDPKGEKTGELTWSLIPKRNSAMDLHLERPTTFGWVGVDHNYTYDRKVIEGSSQGRIVHLDSMIAMVDRDGKIVWETPGLAQSQVFHVDHSVAALCGKDTSLLSDVPGGVLTTGYASEVVRRYGSSPDRVLILDTATGSIEAEFDLPVANLTTVAVIADDTARGGTVIFSTETKDGGQSVTGFSLISTDDGHLVGSADLGKVFPGVSIISLEHTLAGLFAFGEGGTVSRLDLEGKVLWTKTPKNPSSIGPSHANGSVVWASEEGSAMVEREEDRTYAAGPNSAVRFVSITVFDASGKVLLEHSNLKRPIRSAAAAPIAVAAGEGPREGEDYLYVFSMRGGGVAVSRVAIPAVTSLEVSSSGEYVLALRSGSDGKLTTTMYRLAAANK